MGPKRGYYIEKSKRNPCCVEIYHIVAGHGNLCWTVEMGKYVTVMEVCRID
jgi:hypothetical protein